MLLSANKAAIYFIRPSGATLMHMPNAQDLHALRRMAVRSLHVPWAILVDQSEESFWGGTMPALRGSAQTAWIERMANQSGLESPYRWAELQGKSRSEEGKLRVLGYTLGRHEALTPWLDTLQECGARIRGVYAPVMLAKGALDLLKIKAPKGADDISVLVTPHEQGLRQTVMVGGLARFSRLALHPDTDGGYWYSAVYKEIAKLREYLVGNGLLKSDRVGMQIYSVLPTTCIGLRPSITSDMHPKDQFEWIQHALPQLVYVSALAKRQSWRQLAPMLYRKHDLSVQSSRFIWAAGLLVLATAIVFFGMMGAQLWQKNSAIQVAKEGTAQAIQQYDTIAKTFPQTPLSAAQLIELKKDWEIIKANTPPAMRDALVATGQVLERHPAIVIEEVQWSADVNQTLGFETDGSVPITPAAPSPASIASASATVKPEVSALILRGMVRGIASDDLRGTRDTLSKLEADFKRSTKLRPEITKRPLDLSAKSTLSGSGTQDRTELTFEITLWQR